MTQDFLKMHGLGNDFVIVDHRKDGFLPDEKIRIRLSDRHRGIGCDQLIILMPPVTAGTDFFMRIYNPDGSEAGACGNASRCVARLLFEETGRSEGVIETISGLLPICKLSADIFSVDFGEPRLSWDQIPLASEMDTLTVKTKTDALPPACCVNMGNPHAVFFVPDITAIDLEKTGAKIERHLLFPQRTNVEFAQIIDRATIRMRVWERGAGVTQACGSGACATLVAAARRNYVDRKAAIILDGGTLNIEWRDDGHVILSGTATLSYRGTWTEEMLA